MGYQQRYYQKTGSHWLKLRPSYLSQDWTEREINFLTISRGAPNPPPLNTSRGHCLTWVYKEVLTNARTNGTSYSRPILTSTTQ